MEMITLPTPVNSPFSVRARGGIRQLGKCFIKHQLCVPMFFLRDYLLINIGHRQTRRPLLFHPLRISFVPQVACIFRVSGFQYHDWNC